MLRRKRGQIKNGFAFAKKQIAATLSRSLAQELAERVQAYVRGAAMLGSVSHPVSALLGKGLL